MIRAAAVALVVAGLIACNGKAKPAPVKPHKMVEENLAPAVVVSGVKRTLEQYRQAYEVRSLEALAPLYAKGGGIAITHQGKSYRGMASVAEYLNKLLRKSEYIRMSLSNIEVIALSGSSAVAIANINRAIGDGVTTVEATGVLTLALERSKKHWVIVSEHFSYPPRH